MNKVTYKVTMAGVVEVRDGFSTCWLDLKCLKTAIENIKRERDRYKTDEAYQKNLSKYEEALRFLVANDPSKGQMP